MYKYEIERELKNIPDVGIGHFRKYLDKLTKKMHKIILFKNRKNEYSAYYCTKCKTWHFVKTKELLHFKKGDYITCGGCETKLEMIYRNNTIKDYCNYITLCESNSRNELIIREFFYKKEYDKKYGQFYEYFYEVERINIDHKIAMKNNSYKVMGNWGIFHGPTTKGWIRDRSEFYLAYPYDNVYTSASQIKSIIEMNGEYQYSCLDLAVKEKLDIVSYLKLWINYPKTELLMKAGCTRIVKDICTTGTYYNHPYILNKMKKNDINILKKYNLSYKELEVYMKTSIEDYSLLKKGASIGYTLVRLNHDARKVINYIYEKQYNIRDYGDYLRWCNELGANLNDKKILYPAEPAKAHDQMMREVESKKNMIINQGIADFAKTLEQLTYKDENLSFSQHIVKMN